MIPVDTLITAAKSVTLVCGGLVTFFAYRAWQRTSSPALQAMAVGLGLVTVGALAGGAIHQFGGYPLPYGVAVQSVFTATGFAVLAYSLYARTSASRRQTTETGRERTV